MLERRHLTLPVVFVALSVGIGAQENSPKNHSIDPWHRQVPRPVADPVTTVGEKLPGSVVAADIQFVEMRDGVYAPIAVMKPRGAGRFPVVVLAHMNGGGGTRWLREWLHYGNWTPERLVEAGYGFIFVRRNAAGRYEPDAVQRQSVSDAITYFNGCLKTPR